MKNTTQTKFIEELLQEEDLNVNAIINSKFKNPFKTWINYQLFLMDVFISDAKLKMRLFLKRFSK